MANSRTTDCLLTVNGQVPSHRLPHHIATSRNPSSQPPPRYNNVEGNSRTNLTDDNREQQVPAMHSVYSWQLQ